MQVKELIKYIHQPELLDKESMVQLQKLVKDFPYFQSGHILLSLAAKKWDTSIYQQSIKKTAIVVSNREHLFNLIHSPDKEPEKPVETEVTKPQPLVVVAAENDTDQKAVIDEKEIEPEIPQPVKVTKESVEQEIEKAVVTSFVEKEILKTHEVNKTGEAAAPASFGDWLKFMKKNNGQSYSEIARSVKEEDEKIAEKSLEREGLAKMADAEGGEKLKKSKQKQKAIIDKIIETNPGAIRHKEEQKFFKSDLKAKESLLENEHLVTETLARIYALQGNTGKAIRAYEILSLKFPQKSAYFASLIEKLKQNQ